MAALRADREQARSHKVTGDPVGASLLAILLEKPRIIRLSRLYRFFALK
jgi:hypothetical protein